MFPAYAHCSSTRPHVHFTSAHFTKRFRIIFDETSSLSLAFCQSGIFTSNPLALSTLSLYISRGRLFSVQCHVMYVYRNISCSCFAYCVSQSDLRRHGVTYAHSCTSAKYVRDELWQRAMRAQAVRSTITTCISMLIYDIVYFAI